MMEKRRRVDRGSTRCNHDYMSTEPDEDVSGSAADQIKGWFAGRLPGDWFTGPAEIVVDREEITIVGTLPEPEDGAAGSAEKSAAVEGRIKRFREETRAKRIEMAREAEHRFRRKVAWGARCGDHGEMFTTLSVPVMTRLRQSERRVLDTLVDAGVARSRSDALAWCVRLTGEHADAWLTELRDALRRVEEVRSQGPANTTST
jgi:hypothetical protein